MEPNKTFANVFGNEPDVSFEEKMRVIAELTKIGSLSFKVEKNEDGWMAECVEVPAIITGNSNPTPTDFEIESLIREAIFSAFGVRFQSQTQSELVSSPLKFQFSPAFS